MGEAKRRAAARQLFDTRMAGVGQVDVQPPAYDLAKALRNAAKALGKKDYGNPRYSLLAWGFDHDDSDRGPDQRL